MTTTQALAIWGAVTGTTGTVIAVMNYLRDRPALRIEFEPFVSERPALHHRWVGLRLTATNVGHRPATIADAGLAVRWRETWRNHIPTDTLPYSWFTPVASEAPSDFAPPPRRVSGDFPAVLSSGEVFVFQTELWPATLRDAEAEELRPFVYEVRRGFFWGPAVPAAAVLEFLREQGVPDQRPD